MYAAARPRRRRSAGSRSGRGRETQQRGGPAVLVRPGRASPAATLGRCVVTRTDGAATRSPRSPGRRCSKAVCEAHLERRPAVLLRPAPRTVGARLEWTPPGRTARPEPVVRRRPSGVERGEERQSQLAARCQRLDELRTGSAPGGRRRLRRSLARAAAPAGRTLVSLPATVVAACKRVPPEAAIWTAPTPPSGDSVLAAKRRRVMAVAMAGHPRRLMRQGSRGARCHTFYEVAAAPLAMPP